MSIFFRAMFISNHCITVKAKMIPHFFALSPPPPHQRKKNLSEVVFPHQNCYCCKSSITVKQKLQNRFFYCIDRLVSKQCLLLLNIAYLRIIVWKIIRLILFRVSTNYCDCYSHGNAYNDSIGNQKKSSFKMLHQGWK